MQNNTMCSTTFKRLLTKIVHFKCYSSTPRTYYNYVSYHFILTGGDGDKLIITAEKWLGLGVIEQKFKEKYVKDNLEKREEDRDYVGR